MLPLAWQKHWMVKVLPSKISVLPTFQFHVLTTFTIHVTFLDFYKGLTYRRPWKHLRISENNIENILPSWLYRLQATQSAQISQKQDGHNIYVIITRLSPKWFCGNWSTWVHDVCDVHGASSLYIKPAGKVLLYLYMQGFV